MNLHHVQYHYTTFFKQNIFDVRLLGASKSGIVAVLLCVDPVREETLALDHWNAAI